jgi:hypothetical protein
MTSTIARLTAPGPTAAPISRIAAIDLARLVAILGMMGSHLLPQFTELPGSLLSTLTHGFPSTLFAVVAGVGAAIAADRPLRAGRDREAMGAQLARGLTVALIGSVVAMLPTFVAVVLVPLGVAIMLVAPLLRAGTATLAAIAAGLALTGPILISRLASQQATTELGPVQRTFDSVLFTGVYPVITWVVYLITGMLIGRAVLAGIRAGRAHLLGARLAVAGIVAVAVATIVDTLYVDTVSGPALAAEWGVPVATAVQWLRESGFGTPHGTGWDAILIAAPHTGTTLDILRTVGGAAVVIGLLLAVIGGGSVRSWPARVLVAAGGAGLTIYLVHILTTVGLTVAAESGLIAWESWDVPALVFNVAVVLGLGVVLAATGRRGPFEMVIRSAGRTGASIAARTRGGTKA